MERRQEKKGVEGRIEKKWDGSGRPTPTSTWMAMCSQDVTYLFQKQKHNC